MTIAIKPRDNMNRAGSPASRLGLCASVAMLLATLLFLHSAHAQQATTKAAKAAAANKAAAVPDAIDAAVCSASSDSFERTRASVNAKTVYFVNLRDGDKVISPFRVIFGLTGMGIAPAGVKQENTGHHHLLIDKPLTTEMLVEPIPFNESYRHYGKGQTEAIVGLTPGKHKLRLLFADADHKPFYVYSKEITIEVVKAFEK